MVQSYLILGRSGSGKTWLARRLAYLLCETTSDFEGFDSEASAVPEGALNGFIRSGRYLHVQVSPVTTFSDLAMGARWDYVASGRHSALKPVADFVSEAAVSKQKFALVIDDLDRADTDLYVGPLLSIIGSGNRSVTGNGEERFEISENLVLIFTSGAANSRSNLPITFISKLGGIKVIDNYESYLESHYLGEKNRKTLEVAKKLFRKTNDYLLRTSVFSSELDMEPYLLGHGFFIVDLGLPQQTVLNNLYLKYRYSVGPVLQGYWRDNIISEDPSDLISALTHRLEGEIEAETVVQSVEKIFLQTRDQVPDFSSADSHSYIESSLENLVNSANARDMVEATIDAMLTNELLPIDLVYSALLNNPEVGWVENERRPGQRASYLLPESMTDGFVYLTPKNGKKVPHSFFSTGTTRGRRKKYGPTGYRFNYVDNRKSEINVPLNGFRKKSIRIDDAKLYDDGNAAVAFRSCYRLIDAYLELFASCLERTSKANSEYSDLASYVRVERRYHRRLYDYIRENFRGEDTRFYEYAKATLSLKSLWSSSGEQIVVARDVFQRLRKGDSVTVEDFSLLHARSATPTTIAFREVQLMTNFNDYQGVMESLGVRQLIFQGPPGTSKTFESKKFILSQLDPDAACLEDGYPSRDEIDRELNRLKLSFDDYENPVSSPKLTTGGWDIVQFHPAYSYEDFIRGIRVSAKDGSPVYETVNRVLGAIAEFARIAKNKNPEVLAPKYYLLIDEINRADLASVLGELIYGLEYRGSPMTTPYAVRAAGEDRESFELEITENVFIIGTMNTADKSIGTLDYAIRRRFLFIDSPADRGTIINAYQAISGEDEDRCLESVFFDAVQRLFDSPRYFNDDYHRNDVRIGHTFFLRSDHKEYSEQIANRIAFQVIPILREYVRDGILYPLFEPPVGKGEIAVGGDVDLEPIAEQLLYFATTLGNAGKDTDTSEVLIKNWVMDRAKAWEM